MLYYYWILMSAALLTIEVFTGTFVVLFFGVSALLVAAACYFLNLENLLEQSLLFFTISFSGLFFFRKKLRGLLSKSSPFHREQPLLLEKAIAPQEKITLQYQGTVWQAVNATSENMEAGEQVFVERIEGVTLYLTRSKKEGL